MNILKGITWLLIATLLQTSGAQNTPNRDYIIVMEDGISTNEMDSVMTVMHQMSVPINDAGVIAETTNRLKQTTQLINTITGPMSEDAVAMVSYTILKFVIYRRRDF